MVHHGRCESRERGQEGERRGRQWQRETREKHRLVHLPTGMREGVEPWLEILLLLHLPLSFLLFPCLQGPHAGGTIYLKRLDGSRASLVETSEETQSRKIHISEY